MQDDIEYKYRPKKKAKKKKNAPGKMPSFDRYRDRDVNYFGVPFARSKFIKGVWFMRTVDGEYRRFPVQERVIETSKKKDPQR